MSWLDLDATQNRRAETSPVSLWQRVDIRPVDEIPRAVSRYLEELRRVYVNGDAQYARFALTGNADFNWFATRNRWQELDFFTQLLTHPVVRTALPGVTRGMKRTHLAHFEWASSLTLDGELARLLVAGGAYQAFAGPPREAKQLGGQLCEALFDDRYLEVEVYRNYSPWSAWFQDVAWDSTHLLIDRRLQEVSLICATDTD